MGGANRLGKKLYGHAKSIGKKVLKAGAIGGALLIGASYHLGKKEIEKSEADRDRIRREAEADTARRLKEAQSAKVAEQMARESARAEIGDKSKPTAVVKGGLFKKKKVVAAEGPVQDPLDLAAAQALEGQAAAASFEKGKKVGGLKQKLNPFKKKKSP